MDVCLFINQNFGFISFPDEYTTGSSIMPHKKNPDVFEIMRAKCNRLQSVAGEVALMTTNLPVGYQRDFQLLKDVMFPAIEEIKSCLTMCDMMLQHIRVNRDILDDRKYDYLFTVEVQDLLLFGADTRMNTPGKSDGNWRYRITKEQLLALDRNKYRHLNELYGRNRS